MSTVDAPAVTLRQAFEGQRWYTSTAQLAAACATAVLQGTDTPQCLWLITASREQGSGVVSVVEFMSLSSDKSV